MRSTIEVLKAARKLIKDPTRWTKDTYARNAAGAETAVRAKDATCFCAAGAVCRVLGVGAWARNGRKARLREAAIKRLNKYNTGGIFTTNDRLGHAETIRVFNRAIRDLSK